jgi:hypothetical protein
MSRTIQFTSKTLAITGALLAASLAAPAAGHAQAISAERTLLNLTATPSFAIERYYSARTARLDGGISSSIEGARALLGQTPTPQQQEFDPHPAVVGRAAGIRIDGAGALLGQRARIKAPHPDHQVKERVAS